MCVCVCVCVCECVRESVSIGACDWVGALFALLAQYVPHCVSVCKFKHMRVYSMSPRSLCVPVGV